MVEGGREGGRGEKVMAKRVSVLCTHMHSQFGEKREKKLGRGPSIKSPLKQCETEKSEVRNEKQTQRKKDQRLQLTETPHRRNGRGECIEHLPGDRRKWCLVGGGEEGLDFASDHCSIATTGESLF